MSVSGWSIEPPLAYVLIAAFLYWRGGQDRRGRRGRRGGRGRRGPAERLRTAAFVAGLATIVVALESPIDRYADTLFWVHMTQHVLLLTVAPPLILFGRPWPRMWRALPLSWRTNLGRTLAGSRATAPIRRLARPWPAWLLFNGAVAAWHIPGAYDLTLTSSAVHDLEHAIFFFGGLLFWARVIDPGPLRPRLSWPVRIAYVVGAMVVSWVIAIILVMAQHPLYPHYAALAHRPGGISAGTDQQLAGGVMWVPGSIAYSIAVFVGFYRWLEPDGGRTSSRPALTT